jgi:hypothetical protein
MRDVEIIYSTEKLDTSSSNSNKEFSISQYLFGVYYLEGHKKIEGRSLPVINPTREDYSQLEKIFKELGLKL